MHVCMQTMPSYTVTHTDHVSCRARAAVTLLTQYLVSSYEIDCALRAVLHGYADAVGTHNYAHTQ
jgi:hypothetical protein